MMISYYNRIDCLIILLAGCVCFYFLKVSFFVELFFRFFCLFLFYLTDAINTVATTDFYQGALSDK